MRERPTGTELFDGVYATLSAQGRGAALFGDAREAARLFFARSLITGASPALYLEFPLRDEPFLDLLAIYERVPRQVCFAPGGGYGYQGTFDWFSSLDAVQQAAIGIELDLSQGVTEEAGIYFQQRRGLTLLQAFLRTVGQAERADAFLRTQERMPRGWSPSYVGLFPGRAGTPMRLGGYLSVPAQRRCAADPGFLASRFDQMGFVAYDRLMLERCSSLMGLVPFVDFQFDLGLNGSLTDTFGLSLSFGRCRLSEGGECFASGYGAQVMGLLQAWGLADERWRFIPEMTFARRVSYEDLDGRTKWLAVCVRLNYAKVKFVGGAAQAAKFYLAATVEELPT